MMKLLLVDDDAFLRDMYAIKFRERGYEVEVADSPTQGLNIFEHTPDFDVILLDMVMPGMTGTEFIKHLYEHFSDTKVKCIVLSNLGQEEDIAESKAAGAVGYIVKAEMVPSEVVKRVEELAKS